MYYTMLNETTFEVAVAARTNGWVGFGLNSAPGMAGADIVVAAQDDGTGKIAVTDMNAQRTGAPVNDWTQDITVLGAGRSEGVTWFKYSRSLRTCDKSGDQQLDNSFVPLSGLAAMGTSDTLSYHGTSNREHFQFAFASAVDPPLPGDVYDVTVLSALVAVPSLSGTYACSFHVLPFPTETVDIVKYQTLRGSAAGAGVLHHVTMSKCPGPLTGYTDGDAVPCDVGMRCDQTLLDGGYGIEGYTLPAFVGIPVGPNGTTYVLITRHFYNPAGLSTVVDTWTRKSRSLARS